MLYPASVPQKAREAYQTLCLVESRNKTGGGGGGRHTLTNSESQVIHYVSYMAAVGINV